MRLLKFDNYLINIDFISSVESAKKLEASSTSIYPTEYYGVQIIMNNGTKYFIKNTTIDEMFETIHKYK
jgi:hypothetical protein